MEEQKSRLSPEDLVLRVRSVQEAVGSAVLYQHPSGFNKKTVEKWLRGDSYPRPASLQAFCAAAGITAVQFAAPAPRFAAALAEATERLAASGRMAQARSAEQILEVMEGYGKRGGLMDVLSETIRSIGEKTLRKYHEDFAGFYMGYLRWTRWEQSPGKNPKLTGNAFRFLIQVSDLDAEHRVIRARLTTWHHLSDVKGTKRSPWAYEGVMVPLPGKLVFLFEVPNPSFEEMGYVFLITQNAPKDSLVGILASDSSSPGNAPFVKVQPLPAAARVLLKKLDEDDPEKLFPRLSYDREIPEEILSRIENTVHKETGILMTHTLPAKT